MPHETITRPCSEAQAEILKSNQFALVDVDGPYTDSNTRRDILYFSYAKWAGGLWMHDGACSSPYRRYNGFCAMHRCDCFSVLRCNRELHAFCLTKGERISRLMQFGFLLRESCRSIRQSLRFHG